MQRTTKIFIGTSSVAALLALSFFLYILYSASYNFNSNIGKTMDPLEFQKATIYGTLTLTEKIDGNRSGMTVHDIAIKVDYVEAENYTKLYAPKEIKKSSYKALSWTEIKRNILDDNGEGNYIGLKQIPSQFKTKYLNNKVRIHGRIYSLCLETYYLNPSAEKKPNTSSLCSVTSQYHISLPGYYYNKQQ